MYVRSSRNLLMEEVWLASSSPLPLSFDLQGSALSLATSKVLGQKIYAGSDKLQFEAGRFPHRFCTTDISESLCSSLRCYFPRTTAFLRKTNLLLYLLGEKPGRRKVSSWEAPYLLQIGDRWWIPFFYSDSPFLASSAVRPACELCLPKKGLL